MLVRRALGLVGIALLLGGAHGCGLVEAPPDRERSSRPPGERWAETAHPRGDAATVARTTPPDDRALTYLVLRLGERRLYLMGDDTRKPVESFPVAIGRRPYETPTGRFHVREMIEHPDFLQIDWEDPSRVIERLPPGQANNPLGERWIGFTHAYGWGIGFHGTPQPELLGRAVSHGCVRMRNEDIVRVYDRVQVGTTVIVEP